MTTASQLPAPRAVFSDANGKPISGGFVNTYVAGTTTPKTTWQDAAETIPNANPIVLDTAGSALIYGSGTYSLAVTDSLSNAVPGFSGVTQAPGFISDAMLPVVGAATTAAAITALGVLPPLLNSLLNIAALRALTTGGDAIVNYLVEGYYAAADGGGGIYTFISTDITTADNGGTVIVDASNRRWYRQTGGEAYSTKWFGVKGGGADDTAAWQRAINAAVGTTLYDPGSKSLISSPINLPGPIRIIGALNSPVSVFGGTGASTQGVGTWFNVAASTLISVFTATSKIGIEIEHIGIAHAQPALTGGAWTPNNYPAAINLVSCNDCNFHDITLLNPTIGVAISGTNSGRITLERVSGQAMLTGVSVDGALDVCRFMNVHFWPFWTQDLGVMAYIQANGVGFRLGRVDNPTFAGCFTYGYLCGVRCSVTALGVTSRASFVDCGFDHATFMLQIIDSATPGHSVNFSNCYGQGYIGNNGHGVLVGGTTGFNTIQLSNTDLRIFDFSMVAITSTHVSPAANQVFVSGGQMINWDQSITGAVCFLLPTGDITTKIIVSAETALVSNHSPAPAGVGVSVNASPLKFLGVALMAAGTSAITIAHGLGYGPASILCTPRDPIAPATSFWAVGGVTNVTINTSANVAIPVNFYVWAGLQY